MFICTLKFSFSGHATLAEVLGSWGPWSANMEEVGSKRSASRREGELLSHPSLTSDLCNFPAGDP